MYLSFLKSKIHKAKVTECNKKYGGSISIGLNYMKEIGIFENKKADVININNGKRITTHAIVDEKISKKSGLTVLPLALRNQMV